MWTLHESARWLFALCSYLWHPSLSFFFFGCSLFTSSSQSSPPRNDENEMKWNEMNRNRPQQTAIPAWSVCKCDDAASRWNNNKSVANGFGIVESSAPTTKLPTMSIWRRNFFRSTLTGMEIYYGYFGSINNIANTESSSRFGWSGSSSLVSSSSAYQFLAEGIFYYRIKIQSLERRPKSLGIPFVSTIWVNIR